MDTQWIVTEIDGKVASIATDYRHLPHIGAELAALPAGETGSVGTRKISMEELVEFAESRNLYVQIYSNEKLYYREENDKSAYYRCAAGVNGNPVGDELGKFMDNVPKLLIMVDTPEEGDKVVDAISEQFGGRIEAVKSTPVYIELIKPGVNKATAIARLAEKYNIPMDSVLAIGDSNNDLTMIQAAGFGVAMGNANENVKKIAEYEVADCDHDGVAEAIERFCLD